MDSKRLKELSDEYDQMLIDANFLHNSYCDMTFLEYIQSKGYSDQCGGCHAEIDLLP